MHIFIVKQMVFKHTHTQESRTMCHVDIVFAIERKCNRKLTKPDINFYCNLGEQSVALTKEKRSSKRSTSRR